MATPLRILIIEDSPDDAALMVREVRRAGFDVSYQRVESASELAEALSESDWDLILSDYSMPALSGLEALREVQARNIDCPFLIVSGAITEDTAVAAMKAGAHDYVLKDNLARLGPAITRELRESRLRGERRGVQAELEDLKERSSAELRRSRDQLEVILRGVGEGIVVQDAAGEITYMNDAAESAMRTAGRRMLGGGAPSEQTELFDEDGRSLSPEELPAAVALARGRRAEKVVRARPDPGGEERWYMITSSPIFDQRHEVWMAVTIFRDITERKWTETSARFLAEASEKLVASLDYDATLNALARVPLGRLGDWCAIERVGEDGASRLAVAALDASEATRVRALHERFPEVARAVLGGERARERRAPELRAELSESSIRHQVAEAEPREMLLALSPSSSVALPLTARGRIVGTLTLVFGARSGRRHGPEALRLADELARHGSLALEHADLYGQAQEAIAARDEFLSVASHELKTPLTGLLLQLQRLERAPGGDARVESAIRQARRLAALIESMLDVSRVSVGELVLHREPLELVGVVRGVVEELSEEAARAGCRVEVKAPAFVRGEWDHARLEQLVAQLLSNALKYGAGKPVELVIEGTDATACLSVRDHGSGIAERDLPRIFERFERAVSSRQYGGLGLGLFLVRKIVEAHGGRLSAESRPGEGAVFTVLLPRSLDAGLAAMH